MQSIYPTADTPARGGSHRGKRLVAVFAHPDDETFGPGGTFARYAALGAELTLVCGTRGEAGSIGHSRSYGPALLGRIRQAELEAAAEVLGIRRLVLLGYADGGVSKVEPERGVTDVLAVLREVEPDVVVAFHPTGISGHPDHKMMTAFATAAVERLAAGGRGCSPRLHYYTLPASVTRQITYRELPLVPDEDVTIEIDTEPYADVKRRAIFCHKTQLPFYERLTSMPGADGRFAIERYVTHGAPRTAERGTDLFAGPGGAGGSPAAGSPARG
jgi:LmbE family N-acetylglucosaminyl deacetylase